jgi:hypothetical protein
MKMKMKMKMMLLLTLQLDPHTNHLMQMMTAASAHAEGHNFAAARIFSDCRFSFWMTFAELMTREWFDD